MCRAPRLPRSACSISLRRASSSSVLVKPAMVCSFGIYHLLDSIGVVCECSSLKPRGCVYLKHIRLIVVRIVDHVNSAEIDPGGKNCIASLSDNIFWWFHILDAE